MTASVPAAQGAAETLRYPPGSLVILTGLPGAGKTTLLQRLYNLASTETAPVTAGPAVVVIDSHQSRLHWATRLRHAPKPLRGAIVFATHLLRIRRALQAGHAVVAHNRGCATPILYGFAHLARLHRTTLHLLLLDVPPAQAVAGQHARGRIVTPRTFARHHRRWQALLTQVNNGDPTPAASARVLDRPAADRLEALHFDT